METVTHHGRETAYREFDRGASGPRVLAVHGSGGTHRVWSAQAELASDYPFVALDLSGHGGSDDVAAEPGYETLSAYVDDTLAVAEAVDPDVLLGNSLGGAVIITALLEREVDVDGVVLAGTGPRLPVLDDLLRWVSEDFDRVVEFFHEPDHLFHDADAATLDVSRAALRKTGPEILERDFRTAHGFDRRGDLTAIDLPALAIVGEYDRLTPVHYHEALCEELPDCDLTVLDDAAHLAMLESPTAFNDAVRSFLAEL
ncbi:alpha/beta fold hydrolase [Halobellus ordinarius]|uniref:alpha/beta fold hydrolase n=1 Tax=Halobellus ordinarius TaxID=3075120 RepID=UPI0028808F93|nr:alpha/beta hydrolase [Halobellus sp. ZY16]